MRFRTVFKIAQLRYGWWRTSVTMLSDQSRTMNFTEKRDFTLLRTENLRTEFVWKAVMKPPEPHPGMQRHGFHKYHR
jgi:hypothetical protein